ncbi:chorismate mutase [Streptococcus massiliensis]|uniref:Putative chorismate mutase n=1 Tax=Streptococcus massiliensis TaxID=313439 RepID=A0A380L039_9STRE|nr:chorismate mutase [Streptococcus massiliensis]SUN76130.1 putative chorismate mutase [Streptococcus massiliensis]
MDLADIRREIDQVDDELVNLLEKRMELVSQVVAYKQSSGRAILDRAREQAILDKVAAHVENKQYVETIVDSFADLMRHSREYQNKNLS